ncbi:MAG: alkaline phosphatase family protein [Pseudomonadota bacterium]
MNSVLRNLEIDKLRIRAFFCFSKLLIIFLLIFPVKLYAETDKLAQIDHIIVIYMENHSFDNLFGTFTNANGFKNAGDKIIQTDANDKPYEFLPKVTIGKEKEVDKRFPKNLPNKPFLISKYISENEKTSDLVHRFYQLQEQINNGKMDKFSSVSNAGGLTQGYYENKNSPLWQYAKKYTLADNFFTGVFGGSFVNHIFLVCGCIPKYESAPQDIRAELDKNGRLIKDGALTPDGYAVNTIEPFNPPYKKKATDAAKRLPPMKEPNIGDRLSEKNIDWAWYAGSWNKANSGNAEEPFIPHHQPFVYFANYSENSPARKAHLKDLEDFIAAIESNSLPAVSFYKPDGKFDIHPGYANLAEGEEHIFEIVNKIENSKLWDKSLIIITFDDAGGWFDHVMPPKFDRFGAGERVPTIIISPFAKRNFIDKTLYDTASILKLIETKFGLQPFNARDKNAGDLTNALQ